MSRLLHCAMGQTQSRPDKGAVSPGKTMPTPQPPRHIKKKSLPVPENWKNNAEFNQISPVSDISNPSQFRGRLHHNNNNSAPVATGAVRANAGRRASKVCPKQPPPKKGAVPTPANFYFPEEDLPEDEDDTVSAASPVKKPKLPPPQPQPAALNRVPTATAAVPPTIHVGRPWMEIWKAKCVKAKHQLAACFQEPVVEAKKSERVSYPAERKASVPSQLQQSTNNKNKAYLQFDPVWKEDGGIISPGNGKDELAYVHRLSGTESGSSLDKSDNGKSKHQPPTKIPAVGTSVLERIQSLQQASGGSLSSNAFQASRLSVGTNNTSGSLSSGGTRMAESRVQQKQSKRDINPTQNQIENDRNSRHSSNSNPPQSKNVMIEQKAARVNNAEIFRTTSTDRTKTKRASIGRSFSSGSQDLEDGRRALIQAQVQRQIDAQKAGRVQRLRQQYQEQIHSEKQKSTKRRSRSVPARMSEDRSAGKRVSNPPPPELQKSLKRNELPQATTKGGQKGRSASVPRARPSLDGSALLHLSGWKNNKCYEKKEQPLPALLQVAGWKPQPTKMTAERPSLQPKPVKTVSATERPQAKKHSAAARLSEPSQTTLKEKPLQHTVETVEFLLNHSFASQPNLVERRRRKKHSGAHKRNSMVIHHSLNFLAQKLSESHWLKCSCRRTFDLMRTTWVALPNCRMVRSVTTIVANRHQLNLPLARALQRQVHCYPTKLSTMRIFCLQPIPLSLMHLDHPMGGVVTQFRR